MTRCASIVLFAALLLSGTARAAAPSAEQIIRWLPADQVVEVQQIHPLTLIDGEQAYLASVSFPDAGRNFWAGYVLARPALNAAQVLEGYGGQYNGVTLSGELPVIIGGAGSGQGVVEASYSAVVFDGWQPLELYRVEESDNSGNCGYDDKLCEGSRVFLNFVHVGGSDSLRLSVTEVSFSSSGDDDPAPRARTRSELVRLTVAN
jgi:hypothetical protein